jgi:hypothetical protein
MDDLLLFGGCASIVVGVAQLNVPAAFIVAGLLMIGVGLLIGKQNALAAKSVSEQQPTQDR